MGPILKKVKPNVAAKDFLKKNPGTVDKWLAGVQTFDGKDGLEAAQGRTEEATAFLFSAHSDAAWPGRSSLFGASQAPPRIDMSEASISSFVNGKHLQGGVIVSESIGPRHRQSLCYGVRRKPS